MLLAEGLQSKPFKILEPNDPLLSTLKLTSEDFIALLIPTVESTEPPVILLVYLNPIRFDLFVGGTLLISVNERSLLHFELTRRDQVISFNLDQSRSSILFEICRVKLS